MTLDQVLAIIPARAGSKGLPGKNIKNFCGKPLIAWSILTALECTDIDRVIVSTDSLEYAEIAVNYGADVPFVRPDDLASDNSLSIDVIKHALHQIDPGQSIYSIVVLLEPTSPLRTAKLLTSAINKLKTTNARSVVAISKAISSHPSFMYTLDSNDFMKPLLASSTNGILRRQDITDMYYLAGSFYISYVKDLFDNLTFYHSKTAGIVIPPEYSQEIDSPIDFVLAEALMKFLRPGSNF